MAIPLKQSTASQEIPLGYLLDDTDGKTAETGLTIANTDIKLWKHGATSLVNKNSGGATHISGGLYYAVLDATDTNTLGGLAIFVHVAGALPVRVECVVLPANVYDSLVGGSDLLQVDTTQISGDSTAADNLEAAADGTGYNLGGGSVVAASVTGAVGSVTGNVGGSVGSVTGSVGSVVGNVGGNVVGSVDSVVDPVTVGTNNDKSGYALSNDGIDAILERPMDESYPADGGTMSIAQFAYMVFSRLFNAALSGTTLTGKKLDESTTAFVITTDDADDPHSIQRTG